MARYGNTYGTSYVLRYVHTEAHAKSIRKDFYRSDKSRETIPQSPSQSLS